MLRMLRSLRWRRCFTKFCQPNLDNNLTSFSMYLPSSKGRFGLGTRKRLELGALDEVLVGKLVGAWVDGMEERLMLVNEAVFKVIIVLDVITGKLLSAFLLPSLHTVGKLVAHHCANGAYSVSEYSTWSTLRPQLSLHNPLVCQARQMDWLSIFDNGRAGTSPAWIL